MTTSIDTFPDYRKIDTPWEPQPVAWRFQEDSTRTVHAIHRSGVERIDSVPTLLAQVNDPALTHLVREVAVSTRRGMIGLEMSLEETRNDLEQVDDQFRQLELLAGFRVASTEWHVFQDRRGLTRTLARVAIIDNNGRALPDVNSFEELARIPNLSPEEYEIAFDYLTGLDAYFEGANGDPLGDIDRPQQYIFGTPRHSGGEDAIYLVDIEPDLQPDLPHDSLYFDEIYDDEHC
jgi:hypothetical protein